MILKHDIKTNSNAVKCEQKKKRRKNYKNSSLKKKETRDVKVVVGILINFELSMWIAIN